MVRAFVYETVNKYKYSEPITACSNFTFRTNEYWTCAIRNDLTIQIHMAGTCKMGPATDPLAVVDHELRVHGIKGLRVADASIMPQVTSENTGSPSMMIGERVADFVKKYWKSNHYQNEGYLRS